MEIKTTLNRAGVTAGREVVTTDYMSVSAALYVRTHHRWGHEPGQFTEQLLLAASVADLQNLRKLRDGWPKTINAWLLVAENRDAAADLLAKLGTDVRWDHRRR